MKKTLIGLLAICLLGVSAAALADRDRGRYHHGYKHHDRHGAVVYRKHYAPKGYYKPRHKGYYRHAPPGYRVHKYHHRAPRVVHHYYHDDDYYKWMGGLYLLNEVLHHH